MRLKLNHNSTHLQPGEADTSIWVGDLTPEVDDFALYRFFTQRYSSVRCAKVVLDESGFSKGYGFVRFGSEAEQQHALGSLTGEMGLGSKPIKVSMANQKTREENGGGVSPPSATWGRYWPALASESASGWSGQATGAQSGGSWLGLGGGVSVSSSTSVGSGGLPAATSSGSDYSAYHQYYQQYAEQQQQQYAAAWSAWQQAQQQQP